VLGFFLHILPRIYLLYIFFVFISLTLFPFSVSVSFCLVSINLISLDRLDQHQRRRTEPHHKGFTVIDYGHVSIGYCSVYFYISFHSVPRHKRPDLHRAAFSSLFACFGLLVLFLLLGPLRFQTILFLLPSHILTYICLIFALFIYNFVLIDIIFNLLCSCVFMFSETSAADNHGPPWQGQRRRAGTNHNRSSITKDMSLAICLASI